MMVSDQHLIDDEMAQALVDPFAYEENGRAVEVLAWLRANQPLGLARPKGFDPFWVVTRYDDIKAIGMDARRFTSGERPSILIDSAASARIRELTGGRPNLTDSIVQMDDPRHADLRRVTQAWFLPRSIETLKAEIRRIAREEVDGMLARGGEVDFAAEVALNFPLRVILHIMGIPDEELPFLLKLTQEVFGPQDPELAREADPGQTLRFADDRAKAFGDFAAYFGDLLERRRRNPGDDVASVIAQGMVGDREITVDEVINYYITLATAGHDSTSSSLSGAVHGLCAFPAEFAKVKADPALIPQLAEEGFRWTTPFRHFMRNAAEDIDFKGRSIRRNEGVMLSYMSGNRDEAAFADPFTFRADRSPNRHVAFGHGPHLCLGQHLAKAEIQIFLEEMLPRLDVLSFAGEPRFTLSAMVSRLKSLPVTVA